MISHTIRIPNNSRRNSKGCILLTILMYNRAITRGQFGRQRCITLWSGFGGGDWNDSSESGVIYIGQQIISMVYYCSTQCEYACFGSSTQNQRRVCLIVQGRLRRSVVVAAQH